MRSKIIEKRTVVDSKSKKTILRRGFIKTTGITITGSMLISPAFINTLSKLNKNKKVALVRTGIRGIVFLGKFLKNEYFNLVESTGAILPKRDAVDMPVIAETKDGYTMLEKYINSIRY